MRIALLLVLGGLCTLLGHTAAEALRQRARTLAALAESLARLRIEIGFSATPLESAARRVAHGEVEPFWNAFADCLADGLDAAQAFAQTQLDGQADWGERAEAIFADFAGGLGKSDRQSQCARIDETLLRLRRETEASETKARESGKLRFSLGVMAGMALIIVLL